MRAATFERLTVADMAEIARAIDWSPSELVAKLVEAHDRERNEAS